MSVLYAYGTKRFGISHSLTAAPDPAKFTLHTHPYVEIYCFLQGSAVFHIEGTAYPLECGDLLLMRSTESHYVEVDPSQPYERINVRFDLDLLDFMDPDSLLQAPFLARVAGKQNRYPGHLFHGGSCLHYFDTMMSGFPDRQVSFLPGWFLCCRSCASCTRHKPKMQMCRWILFPIKSCAISLKISRKISRFRTFVKSSSSAVPSFAASSATPPVLR